MCGRRDKGALSRELLEDSEQSPHAIVYSGLIPCRQPAEGGADQSVVQCEQLESHHGGNAQSGVLQIRNRAVERPWAGLGRRDHGKYGMTGLVIEHRARGQHERRSILRGFPIREREWHPDHVVPLKDHGTPRRPPGMPIRRGCFRAPGGTRDRAAEPA